MKKGNRHYDKWYKELWWFLQENIMWVFTIGLGIGLGLLFAISWCWILER